MPNAGDGKRWLGPTNDRFEARVFEDTPKGASKAVLWFCLGHNDGNGPRDKIEGPVSVEALRSLHDQLGLIVSGLDQGILIETRKAKR